MPKKKKNERNAGRRSSGKERVTLTIKLTPKTYGILQAKKSRPSISSHIERVIENARELGADDLVVSSCRQPDRIIRLCTTTYLEPGTKLWLYGFGSKKSRLVADLLEDF